VWINDPVDVNSCEDSRCVLPSYRTLEYRVEFKDGRTLKRNVYHSVKTYVYNLWLKRISMTMRACVI